MTCAVQPLQTTTTNQPTNMNTSTATETVALVKSRQSIWVEWMQRATTGLTDESLVEVTTHNTPFGSFCISIKPVTK